MAIGVTLPIIAPSGLEAALQTGGSLDVDTTYYYIVMAYDALDCTPAASSATTLCFHSPISEESSFTTSGTELSALINWTNVAGAVRYQILVSEISGDYTNSKMYGTVAENLGTITDGSAGYTVTALGTDTYAHHSCQLVNNLPGNLNKDAGLINVALSGAETHDLRDLYDAIIGAGFSDYVYYDGAQFVLKGSITVAASVTDAGHLTVIDKKIAIVRGCLSNLGTNYIIEFGTWTSDEYGANYNDASIFEIGNSRYPVYGKYEESIKFYGCIVRGLLKSSNLTENSNVGYYHGGSAFAYQGYIVNWQDCIISGLGRGALGKVKDLKWSESNNWGGSEKIRIKTNSSTSSHSWSVGKFYKSTFTQTGELTNAYYDYPSQYNIRYYDCTFNYTDNLVGLNKIRYTSTVLNWEYGAQGEFFFWFYNTFKVTVIDENGDAIEGVTVSATDTNGNAAEWVEQDETFDRLITGTEYTTSRTTDSSGQIDYYLESYKMNLNQPHVGSSPTYDSVRYAKYPYTINFNKLGYINNSFKINMWRAEDTIVTMKSSYLSNKIFDRKLTRLKTT
jgi:hypothetical protein